MKRFFLLITLFANFLHALTDIDKTIPEKEIVVQVDGAEIFCKVIGQGDPIFVIQGGPGLTYNVWSSALSKLAETHLIVFFEHRGSYRSIGEINYDTMKFDVFVEDLESLRKFFGFTKISLIGDCWGGGLAMKYTIAHPESVDKLALLNTMPSSFEDLILAGMEFKSRIAPYKKEIHAIQESQEFLSGNQDTLNRLHELNLMPQFYNSELATTLALQQMLSLQVMTNLAKMRDIFTHTEYSKYFNWNNQLQELKNPTLIICGNNDWIPVSANEKIHKAISNSKLIVFKDCGHITIYEKPDEVLDALKDFFSQN